MLCDHELLLPRPQREMAAARAGVEDRVGEIVSIGAILAVVPAFCCSRETGLDLVRGGIRNLSIPTPRAAGITERDVTSI